MLLKGEYVKLLTDKDCLIEWGKPQLEALYISKIGNRQLELLQVNLEVKRLKRAIKMAVYFVNRNETINWSDIERFVDKWLERDYEKILIKAKHVDSANHLVSNLVSTELSAE